MEDRWRVVERFAEYGAFHQESAERQTQRLVGTELSRSTTPRATAPARPSGCARSTSPNRAFTVRVHNGVVAGDRAPGTPWAYVPARGTALLTPEQLPPGETFAKKTDLAVAMLRQADNDSPAPILAVFDGAYANQTVIRPCPGTSRGERIDVVTRLRCNARLYKPVPTVPVRAPGRPRKWGERLPAPEDRRRPGGARWQSGTVYLYGRERTFRFKERSDRWSVTGTAEPVRVFVFEVEGYAEPWFLVTTSATLTPAEVVAAFAARFRQEDGFRDHKQRLGMEKCRAWTKAPVERTFVVQMVALTLMRLLLRRLDASPEVGRRWRTPDWNRKKSHPSVLVIPHRILETTDWGN